MTTQHYSADELFNVFFKWINTFDLIPNQIQDVIELGDGVLIFKLLSKLSPTYFDDSVSINQFPRTQFDKNSNIIELKQCLEQFFNDVIDEDIAIDQMVDHHLITSTHPLSPKDPMRTQHYVRLLEMILLCSIKCENKHETIGKMTSLSMDEQRTLMTILQALMTNSGFVVKSDVTPPSSSSPSPHPNHSNSHSQSHSISNPRDPIKNSTATLTQTKSSKSSKSSMLTPVAPSHSFRRLSMAQYSNDRKQNPLLSPFGSKRKAHRFSIDSSISISRNRTSIRPKAVPLRFNNNTSSSNTNNTNPSPLRPEPARIRKKMISNNSSSSSSSTEIRLEKENLKLREQNESLSKELNALKSEHKETTRHYLQCKDELQSMERRIRKEESAKFDKMEKRLNERCDERKDDVKRLEEEVRYKNEEIAAYKQHVESLQTENDQMSVRLEDMESAHDRQRRELEDELDIAQHQSDSVYAMKEQIKHYQQRLEAMNDVKEDLTKYQDRYKEQCAETEALKDRLAVIPSLKQQIEKYKSQMIQYKVAAIGGGAGGGDGKWRQKMTSLEERATKLQHENDSLKLRLKTSRTEMISLQSQIKSKSSELVMARNEHKAGTFGVSADIQHKVCRLEAENKRLRASMATKETMTDLMDELDTKSRLLNETERRYEATKEELQSVTAEFNKLKATSSEWMRNSCSPQQYQSTLEAMKDLKASMAEKEKYIDVLKKQIDELRERKISATSTIAGYESELNRVKQRYRDLFEYAEQQKERMAEYKKAVSELKSVENKEESLNFEARKWYKENEEMKAKMKGMEQEMECVQNACLHLLKRQVLINNDMLSNSNSTTMLQRKKRGGGRDDINNKATTSMTAATTTMRRNPIQKRQEPLTVDKLTEFNRFQKTKEQQATRQNMFIAQSGRGANDGRGRGAMRTRGEMTRPQQRQRGIGNGRSSFSFSK